MFKQASIVVSAVNYNATNDDRIIHMDTSGGNRILFLPITNSRVIKFYEVTNTGGNILSVFPWGGEILMWAQNIRPSETMLIKTIRASIRDMTPMNNNPRKHTTNGLVLPLSTATVVTHNLSNNRPIVQVYNSGTLTQVSITVISTWFNTITLTSTPGQTVDVVVIG
jgi:hypothetical protein